MPESLRGSSREAQRHASGDVIRLEADDLEWRVTDHEILVLHRTRGCYLAITGSGRLLWPLLVDGATCAQLEEVLTSGYAVDPARARHDIAAFVDQLHRSDLLEPIDATPG